MKLKFRVIFHDIRDNFYDNSNNELHLDKQIIGNEKRLKEVLEHELPHYFLKSTWKNILYEYNWLFRGIAFMVLAWLLVYEIQKLSIYDQLKNCISLYNNLTLSKFNSTIIHILNST